MDYLLIVLIICLSISAMLIYLYWHGYKTIVHKVTLTDYTFTYPKEDIAHSVLLIGDAGYPALDGKDAVLNIIKHITSGNKSNQTMVFLGDNVYPKGLPPIGHKLRPISEKRLLEQLSIFKDYTGRLVYLSGNHDWNKGKKNGYVYLQRQENFINNYFGKVIMMPAKGYPGPEVINLTDKHLLIVLNTQWWVHAGPKPLDARFNSKSKDSRKALLLLDSILKQNKDKNILVVAHHPLYSNALHGGKFTSKHHLFPLTSVHKNLYLPLPLAGSLYPLYRRVIGAREDMAHPRYRKLRKALLKIFSKYKNIIYAAGHDHNLQYFEIKNNHYIVSGSGSKVAYVKNGGKASFTRAHKGFFQIDYLHDGAVWLYALEPSNQNNKIHISYQKQLM